VTATKRAARPSKPLHPSHENPPVDTLPVTEAEAREALEAYVQRRAVDRDIKILAQLDPLIDQAKAAGMSVPAIAAIIESGWRR
jgi:hypothetical protein